ncbi:MAG: hypothetical protein R3C01_17660 [Planctomycetaceae bacterium]
MTPRLPVAEETERPPTEGERNSATCLALVALLAVSAGLFGILALVLPGAMWILLVALGAGGVLTLQYLLWGRWLTRITRAEQSTDDTINE